jgi:predicted ABC-type ATPase
MSEFQHVHRPLLMLVRGLPGSGKTHIVTELIKDLDANEYIVLDPDATDYQSQAYKAHTDAMKKAGIEPIYYPYRFLRAKAQHAIAEHKIIIWNQPFTLLGGFNRTIDYLQNVATEQGITLPTLVVEVEITEETARKRVAERKLKGGHGPSGDAFKAFMDDYVSFAAHAEGRYKTVTVHGEDEALVSVATIKNALNALPRN